MLAIATSHEPWQTNGLSDDARKLFDVVKRRDTRTSGTAARELQERLLVHADQVHTEGGKHEIELHAWSRVARMRGVEPAAQDAAARIEAAVESIGGKVTSLPWRRRRSL